MWIRVKKRLINLDKMESIFIDDERVIFYCSKTLYEFRNKKYHPDGELTDEEFKKLVVKITDYYKLGEGKCAFEFLEEE